MIHDEIKGEEKKGEEAGSKKQEVKRSWSPVCVHRGVMEPPVLGCKGNASSAGWGRSGLADTSIGSFRGF